MLVLARKAPSLLGNSRIHPLRLLFLLAFVLSGANPAWATLSLTFHGRAVVIPSGVPFDAPGGLVTGPNGSQFFANTGANQIVVINPQGTAAVLGISGLSPALVGPRGLAMDGVGNLYIADTGNHRVVKVTPGGTGSEVALGGLTLASPWGVALDLSGNVFIADTANNRIVELPAGGVATALNITVSSGSASLSAPKGLGMSPSGVLYIADSANNRIVSVPAGSSTGTVLSPTMNATPNTFSNPSAVAIDRLGNVFIADTGNNRIMEVDTYSKARALTFSNSGLTVAAPEAVAIDFLGTIHIADTGNNRGVAVDHSVNADVVSGADTFSLNKTVVNFGRLTLGGSTPVVLTLPVTLPASPAFGAVKVFTAGTENLDFSLGAGTTAILGTIGAANIEVSFLPTAAGMRKGSVVIYDNSSPAVPLLTIPLVGFCDAPVAALGPNLGSVLNVGGVATPNPFQIALDGAGNMYCGNYSSKNVIKIPAGGGSAAVVSLGTPGGVAVQNITGVALDGAGNLFIGDHSNSRILVMTPAGVVSVLNIPGLSPALGFPTALNFDGAGNLYIADFTSGRLIQVSNLKVAGSTASGIPTVLSPGAFPFRGSTLTGLAVDPSGNVYAAARTTNNSSIIKITPAGAASKLVLPGVTILNPQGVASDAFGNIYVVDTDHNTIVLLTTAGLASSLSISGIPGPSTTLGSTLFGVTVDPGGNLYIPDWTNNRIVFVNVSGAAMSFATTKMGLTSSDSPKTATVTNLGNQPLVFSADPTFTSNFSSNSADTNPILMGGSLAPGMNGNVSVKFTPQAVGSLSAGIMVTDNTLNIEGSTQQISVSGTATNPGDTTATVVSFNPTSLVGGQAVTITATVSDTTTGNTAVIPTGPVTFTDTLGSNTTDLNSGSAVNLNAGKAVLTGVVLSGIGTHTITAHFGGVTGAFLASYGTQTVVVSRSTPTVVLSSNAASAPLGTAVTFTATVTNAAGSIPTGSVTFLHGTTTLGSAPLSSGVASFTLSTLPVGTFGITASYAGDSANSPAVSTVLEQLISKLTATVTLTSSAGSVPAGIPVTFTATVTNAAGSIPTGSVTFLHGTNPLGMAPLSSGVAPFTLSTLPVGTCGITASYAGDSANSPAASTVLEQFISKLTATITLTSSAGSVPAGIPLTFTATVTNQAHSAVSGTVSFMNGNSILASVALATGSVSYSTANLTPGSYSISAVYSGDDVNLSAVSASFAQTISNPEVVILTPPPPFTVSSGGTATTRFTLSSLGTLGAPITLTVAGLPEGATCTFDKDNIVITGSPVTVTATITTTQRLRIIGKLQDPLSLGLGTGAMLLGGLFAIPSRRRKRVGIFLSGLLLLMVGGLTACGSGNSSAKGITTGTSGTPAGTYTVTITASSQGAVEATSTISLTVN